MPSLDTRIAALAARDRPLAEKILKEAIRIPADYVDRPVEEGGDPDCGLSNHEGPRMEYLRRTVVEVGAVRGAEDVDFDEYGNLVWVVEDPSDGVPTAEKRVIYWCLPSTHLDLLFIPPIVRRELFFSPINRVLSSATVF